MKSHLRLSMAASVLMVIGCQQSPPNHAKVGATTPTSPASNAASSPDEEAEIRASLAELSPEDRKLAEAQRFCAVDNDSRLGTMGAPAKIIVNGETVFLCCMGCAKEAKSHPEETVAKVKELRAKNAAQNKK